jgi:hypothetical protein
MSRFKAAAISILTSWWLIGLIGWTIVVCNYPIDQVLPTYAE